MGRWLRRLRCRLGAHGWVKYEREDDPQYGYHCHWCAKRLGPYAKRG